MSDQRSDLLRFWLAVEMFDPQKAPAAEPRDGVWEGRAPTELLPWQVGHPAAARPVREGRTRRHTVFLGVYDIELVSEHLGEIFGKNDSDYERRQPGHSALATFSVTADGRAIADSLTVSTCAWATGRSVTPGPGDPRWLDGFDLAAEQLTKEFEKLTALRGPSAADQRTAVGQTSLDAAAMCRLVDHIAGRLGGTDVLKPAGWRVRTVEVPTQKAHEPDEAEFLNSFLLDDLQRVREALPDSVGSGLGSYLTTPSATQALQRLDVRDKASLDTVAEMLRPEIMPSGRWPAAVDRPLAASQQFAVATALHELRGSKGIFAVNGPPGTGKTTMLRDMISDIVVRRADALVRLEQAEDAFVGDAIQFRTGEKSYRVHPIRPDLTGHEIVIASTNNGAVENLSLELPGVAAVASWPGDCAYHQRVAQRVADVTDDKQQSPRMWGLLSARLGNVKNRRAFISGFWWEQHTDNAVPGMKERLEAVRNAEVRASWPDARADYRQAQAAVERCRAARVRHRADTAKLQQAEQRHAELRVRCEQLRRQADEAGVALADAEREQSAVAGSAARMDEAWQARLALRASWWEQLKSFGGAGRQWQRDSKPLAVDRAAASERYARAVAACEAAQRVMCSAAEALQSARADKAAVQRKVQRLRSGLGELKLRLGPHDPAEWPHRPDRERELGAPWLDAEWNEARTKCFLAALRLHEVWAANAGPRLYANLWASVHALEGSLARLPDKRVHRIAWQSLFLVVPTVSTTFASVSRMFAGLGPEALGWLFVDEAGQATPQALVGALWRTQRAIVVGDPLQVEPVVTVPFPAQARLAATYGVDERWLPARNSVQTLADALSSYGTCLPASDGTSTWVGAPLRIHRRCIDPMFSISNRIAYGGMMIQATVEAAGPDLPESCWYDVAGSAEKHWRPEQGTRAMQLVAELLGMGLEQRDIFVITPFRSVADKLRDELRARYLRDVRCGTVHTAQGREAAVVILVLAGNPQQGRAKSFATERPNVLNVAVSRAQRRLYLVGSRAEWQGQRHFDALAQLPSEQRHDQLV